MEAVRLGFRCNNACAFCAQGRLRTGDSPADADAVRARIVDACAAGDELAFVGGEPTLDDALPDWVRAARAAGARWILVQTNGRRLAYASWARELASAGVDALEVSLQGSTAPMHDWHTGVDGSFVQTVRGIGHARAAGIAVAVSTVITRSNFRHLAEIARVAHARGADAIRFASIVPAGRARDAAAGLVPAPDLVRPHLAAAVRVARALGVTPSAPGVAVPPALERRFAGLGEVEPEPAAPAAEGAEVHHFSLPVLSHDGPPAARIAAGA